MADRQRKRILVVDDDPQLLKTVASMLTSVGFDVIKVEGASAALVLIELERPDAILTDIHMAEGDGIELINAIRGRGIEVPIIAMSGGSSSGSNYLELARKLGAAAVIHKPFRTGQVAETIDRAISDSSNGSQRSPG